MRRALATLALVAVAAAAAGLGYLGGLDHGRGESRAALQHERGQVLELQGEITSMEADRDTARQEAARWKGKVREGLGVLEQADSALERCREAIGA